MTGGRPRRPSALRVVAGRNDDEGSVLKLHMVLPDQVRAVWPLVRARVAAVQAACQEAWIVEDVFNALSPKLVDGRTRADAFLWMTPDADGFLILQVADQSFGRDLHCWICCNESGAPPLAYWPQLVEIARGHNCQRITFENDRPGFQRHIPGLRCRFSYSADVI